MQPAGSNPHGTGGGEGAATIHIDARQFTRLTRRQVRLPERLAELIEEWRRSGVIAGGALFALRGDEWLTCVEVPAGLGIRREPPSSQTSGRETAVLGDSTTREVHGESAALKSGRPERALRRAVHEPYRTVTPGHRGEQRREVLPVTRDARTVAEFILVAPESLGLGERHESEPPRATLTRNARRILDMVISRDCLEREAEAVPSNSSPSLLQGEVELTCRGCAGSAESSPPTPGREHTADGTPHRATRHPRERRAGNRLGERGEDLTGNSGEAECLPPPPADGARATGGGAPESLRIGRQLARRVLARSPSVADRSREGQRSSFPEFIGRSPQLALVLDTIRKVAPRDASILVRGESGTGKELVGRALHRLSSRRNGPFVSESCAALSESLLEAELFGCVKGAFTGADRARAGLIERADGGTLFLDEIGEMSPGLQAKLLRVLQEREVRRVGGAQSLPVDFRLISATHRDLETEAAAGRFRWDLLYRIQVIPIHLPALRERKEDIPLLVHHFIREIAGQHGTPPPAVDADALRLLQSHPWPGNIRELRNEIERAVTLDPERVTAETLSDRLQQHVLPVDVARRVRLEIGPDLEGVERVVLGGIIREILRETRGNKAQAARILGIPKTSLYRKMAKYGLR